MNTVGVAKYSRVWHPVIEKVLGIVKSPETAGAVQERHRMLVRSLLRLVPPLTFTIGRGAVLAARRLNRERPTGPSIVSARVAPQCAGHRLAERQKGLARSKVHFGSLGGGPEPVGLVSLDILIRSPLTLSADDVNFNTK